MTGDLAEADLARLARPGCRADRRGAAWRCSTRRWPAGRAPVLVPVRLDLAVLRAGRRRDVPAAAARPGRVRRRRPAAGPGSAWRAGWRPAGRAGRARPAQAVLELVRAAGRGGARPRLGRAVEPGRAFRELGFDSLTAVELRNRLDAAPGCGCPPRWCSTIPTPAALASFLLGRAASGGTVGRRRGAGGGRAGGRGSRWRSWGWAAGTRAGSGRPEELWELVAAGGDAISRVPGRPGLGPGAAVSTPTRSRPGPSYARAGGFLDERGGFRRGVLRDQPAGGAGDGPAAAAAAGGALGGAGRRRDRPGVAARHPDRRVRRGDVPRLRRAGRERRGRLEGYLATGSGRQRGCRAGWRTRSGWRARR